MGIYIYLYNDKKFIYYGVYDINIYGYFIWFRLIFILYKYHGDIYIVINKFIYINNSDNNIIKGM